MRKTRGYREGSPEAQAFVYQRAKRIPDGHVDQVVKGLRLIVTKRRLTGTKAKTLLDAAGYYQRNRQRMRYDTYLANGWPIASGSVEGACKNLIRDRFETLRHALDPRDRPSPPVAARPPPLKRLRRLLGIPHPAGPAAPLPHLATPPYRANPTITLTQAG